MAILQVDEAMSLVLAADGLPLLDAPDVGLLAQTPELLRIILGNGLIETFIGVNLDQAGGIVQSYRIDTDIAADANPFLFITDLSLPLSDMMAGPDVLWAALQGDDTLFGGNYADYLYGFAGADLVYGGDGIDLVNGQHGDDTLFGNFATDYLLGDAGADMLFGGRGADILYGNQGQDMLYGNLEGDYLFGGAGDDLLFGGGGGDVLAGGAGNDWLAGGIGDDWLRGDQGADTLMGGAGHDIFDLSDLGISNFGPDLVYDLQAEDQILIPETALLSQNGSDVLLDHHGYLVTLVGVDLALVQAIATLTSVAT